MANSSKKQKWIKDAIKRPGAYANKVMSNKKDFSKRTQRQASLAKTLMGFKKRT